MYVGATTLRGRPRNRWQNEVREDGRMVGGEGWQEKVHNRKEWKKLLRTAKNRHILHMPKEWINRQKPVLKFCCKVACRIQIKNFKVSLRISRRMWGTFKIVLSQRPDVASKNEALSCPSQCNVWYITASCYSAKTWYDSYLQAWVLIQYNSNLLVTMWLLSMVGCLILFWSPTRKTN